MRKLIKTITLFSLPLFVACGGGSSKTPEVVNEAPSKVNLVYPTPNLLCIDNTIAFNWSDATDPNNDNISYKVEFSSSRSMAPITKTETVNTSTKSIVLAKGTAYYWRVTAIDAKGLAGEASDVSAFYTKGDGVANSAPFIAEIVSPADEKADVAAGDVTLTWKGADSNDATNTLKYEVFFSEDTDPASIETNYSETTRKVTVTSGKTYYWKINTIDPSNAKSIGQVWSFKVN